MDEVRSTYRRLTDKEAQKMQAVKTKGQELLDEINDTEGFLGDGPGDNKARARGFAIARTKVEEAVMWAVKAIT